MTDRWKSFTTLTMLKVATHTHKTKKLIYQNKTGTHINKIKTMLLFFILSLFTVVCMASSYTKLSPADSYRTDVHVFFGELTVVTCKTFNCLLFFLSEKRKRVLLQCPGSPVLLLICSKYWHHVHLWSLRSLCACNTQLGCYITDVCSSSMPETAKLGDLSDFQSWSVNWKMKT